MQITCPSCSAEFPLDAGFIDSDGKRLAAMFASMEPALGRAVLSYLRLFKPPKNALRLARGVKIVKLLVDLVDAGTVCRDDRGGIRRPATPAMWAAGIDQMLDGKHKLELPLANHNYLRAIVFGLADQAEADAEQKKEMGLRLGRRRPPPATSLNPVRERIAYLRQQLEYGQIDQAQFDAQVRAAREEATR